MLCYQFDELDVEKKYNIFSSLFSFVTFRYRKSRRIMKKKETHEFTECEIIWKT